MAVEKPKDERTDQIFKRLAQIEAALWEEYREIVDAKINGGSVPTVAAGMVG